MHCDVTYEELAGFAAGDLDEQRQATIREHLLHCERCRRRNDALKKADAALAALPPARPRGSAILKARRALAEVTRGPHAAEIMTLEEAAEFLRITPDQLGEIAEELPAFELAGQIRIRRARLVEWVQQRERDYARQAAASWAAQAEARGVGMGVT